MFEYGGYCFDAHNLLSVWYFGIDPLFVVRVPGSRSRRGCRFSVPAALSLYSVLSVSAKLAISFSVSAGALPAIASA